MMNRIRERLKNTIPKSQAVYEVGRSTTEQVCTIKLITERVINTSEEEAHLILLDMSKAFDSMERKKLLEDLSEIIEHEELHIIQILLDVNLVVRCGNELSDEFKTDTGGPQGDGLSGNEFTFYLAKALKEYTIKYRENKPPKTNEDHISEHNYCKKSRENFNIDMQYADDISEITSDMKDIDLIKKELPNILKESNLILNKKKTEEYTINTKNHEWKKCKFLGSYIDTEKDITNRKVKAIDTANDLQHIFNNNKLSMQTKIKALNIYVKPVFMYNSELWTLTKTLNDKINSFQRWLQRTFILNIKYPKIITNTDLKEKIKEEEWSKIIEKKRLTWFGHMARLNDNTPCKKALSYTLQEYKKKQGRPKYTWLTQIEKQLKSLSIQNINEGLNIAQDRDKWKQMTKGKQIQE